MSNEEGRFCVLLVTVHWSGKHFVCKCTELGTWLKNVESDSLSVTASFLVFVNLFSKINMYFEGGEFFH